VNETLDQGTTRSIALRPYQTSAIERMEARARAGVRRIVLVAATGAGKTTIAAQIILNCVTSLQRVLFIAHRRELINQAYLRLLAFGFAESEIGVIMASDPRRRPAAPVQIASVDTLRTRPRPPADVVFVDECHRAQAKSYRDIAAAYPHALHLGLTATPYRADGKGLADSYDELLVVASPKRLIAEGYLVEPRVFTVAANELPDLSAVRTLAGDYEERALADAVNRTPLVGNIVDHWLRLAAGIRTVVFAVSVAHSRHIVERFRGAGIAAEHLDGTTPLAERDAILRRVDEGTTTVVSNCGVLCEGWDQPSVKCAVLARPTKSTGLYLQQAGRILRPWEGQGAIILDHGGCAVEHGLPQDDREFSLEGDERRRRKQGPKDAPPTMATRTCARCFAVVTSSLAACPECGFEFPVPSVPEEADGSLVEVSGAAATADVTRDPRFQKWQGYVAEAARRGFKPGWAYYRFKALYGVAPPRAFQTATAIVHALESQPSTPDLFDKPRVAESAAWEKARNAIFSVG
jgi:superfamily II DNA or RNA helicase